MMYTKVATYQDQDKIHNIFPIRICSSYGDPMLIFSARDLESFGAISGLTELEIDLIIIRVKQRKLYFKSVGSTI